MRGLGEHPREDALACGEYILATGGGKYLGLYLREEWTARMAEPKTDAMRVVPAFLQCSVTPTQVHVPWQSIVSDP